jgi:hypothetical protein
VAYYTTHPYAARIRTHNYDADSITSPCARSTATHVKHVKLSNCQACQGSRRSVTGRLLKLAPGYDVRYHIRQDTRIASAVTAGSARRSAHLRPLWEDLPSWSEGFGLFFPLATVISLCRPSSRAPVSTFENLNLTQMVPSYPFLILEVRAIRMTKT